MQYCLFEPPRPLLAEINDRLQRRYGHCQNGGRLDPVSQLIRSLIGSRTRDEVSGEAFETLRQRFQPWDMLIAASDTALLRCLSHVNYAERKAPQLRSAVRMIQERSGLLSLEFLRTWPVEDAQFWLRQLPGVDAKVSAAVLNSSTLRMRMLVVDCHHERVARRLGLLTPKTSSKAAHRILMSQHVPTNWSADDLDLHHSQMKLHGQLFCRYYRPLCSGCLLQDLCPTGEKERRAS